MLDRELQHSTSHSPTSLLEKNGKKERENLCFVPGINRKEIHGRFLFRKIMPKQSGTWWSFCFLPPQSNREEKNLIVLYESETGLESPNSVASGKERKQTPIIWANDQCTSLTFKTLLQSRSGWVDFSCRLHHKWEDLAQTPWKKSPKEKQQVTFSFKNPS